MLNPPCRSEVFLTWNYCGQVQRMVFFVPSFPCGQKFSFFYPFFFVRFLFLKWNNIKCETWSRVRYTNVASHKRWAASMAIEIAKEQIIRGCCGFSLLFFLSTRRKLKEIAKKYIYYFKCYLIIYTQVICFIVFILYIYSVKIRVQIINET